MNSLVAVGIFCFIGLPIILIVISFKRHNKAKTAYEASLQQLSNEPENVNPRKVTLELGRAYAKTTHGSYHPVGEGALMNDK